MGFHAEYIMVSLPLPSLSLLLSPLPSPALSPSPALFPPALNLIFDLRKIALHPHLIRHHYHDDTLKKMTQDILKDPQYMDSDPDLVYEDMSVMTDFELHNMCKDSKVRYLS